MVCLAVPVFGGRVPVDRSLPKLRQAHEQFDRDNFAACAVLLREAIRLHLLAIAEFYNVKLENSKRPATMLKQLREAKALPSGADHWFGEILYTCRKILDCKEVGEGVLSLCLAFGYEQIASHQVKFGRV